ncbi:MAG: hypothetical protein KC414_04660 [Romboutsia sp.]|nr:hypothetical protein [Romboutsia sp.]
MYELLRIILILLGVFQLFILISHIETNQNILLNNKDYLVFPIDNTSSINLNAEIREGEIQLYTSFYNLTQNIIIKKFEITVNGEVLKNNKFDSYKIESKSNNFEKKNDTLVVNLSGNFNKFIFISRFNVTTESNLTNLNFIINTNKLNVTKNLRVTVMKNIAFEYWGHGDITPFIGILSLFVSLFVFIRMQTIRKN